MSSRAPLSTHLVTCCFLAALLACHFALAAAFWVEHTLTAWLLLAGLGLARGYGITIGFHRLLAHRSFRTYRPVQFVLAFLGTASLQLGPLSWVSYHRDHHRYADAPEDVHSPVERGLWWAHAGWIFDFDLRARRPHGVGDLARYGELVFLDRFGLLPAFLVLLLCWALGGWSGVVIGFCGSIVLQFHCTCAVNSIGHRFGSRRFATNDQSRNNGLVAFLALGEGWHNNHHRYPASARQGFYWWEYDPSYTLILLMERVGLAWDVKRPPAAVYEEARQGVPGPPAAAG